MNDAVATKTTTKTSYVAAIAQAQLEEMRRDSRVFIMGEDVQSGLYGVLDVEEFGSERIRNTPISEAGFLGAGIGAAMTGLRPIVDLGCPAFMYGAMDQLVNQAAKNRYLFGGQATIPIVVRMAMYYGSSLAAHHTDRPYPMLMNTPGLKVIAPASPYDAKGLLKAAIREDDPVVCFEDTNLWGTTAELPDDDFVVPLGSAEIKRAGDDVTVVAVSGAAAHALLAAEDVTEDQISVEVVDPRTLVPMDWETILASVRKTGRLVVADPANRTCGAAAEIMATVAESCFGDLRAPMIRVTTPDIQIPFSPSMERGLFPNRVSIAAAVRRVCDIKGDDRGR